MITSINWESEVCIMACGCSSAKSYTVQLINRIAHNEETYSFDFAAIEPIIWREGDSSNVFLAMDGQLIGKKFSYASLPEEKVIRFTTRIREKRSAYKERFNQLKIGDFVEVSAPNGHFSLVREGRPALLLSNGVGIATMRSLIKAFEKNQQDVIRLTQINVDASKSIYEEEFAKISNKIPAFKTVYVNHRSDFYNQLDHASQELMFATGMVPLFYVVGSDQFVQNVSAYIMSIGFDMSDVLTDGQSAESGCGCGGSSSSGCGCAGDVNKCDCGKYDFHVESPLMTLKSMEA